MPEPFLIFWMVTIAGGVGLLFSKYRTSGFIYMILSTMGVCGLSLSLSARLSGALLFSLASIGFLVLVANAAVLIANTDQVPERRVRLMRILSLLVSGYLGATMALFWPLLPERLTTLFPPQSEHSFQTIIYVQQNIVSLSMIVFCSLAFALVCSVLITRGEKQAEVGT